MLDYALFAVFFLVGWCFGRLARIGVRDREHRELIRQRAQETREVQDLTARLNQVTAETEQVYTRKARLN